MRTNGSGSDARAWIGGHGDRLVMIRVLQWVMEMNGWLVGGGVGGWANREV